MSLKALHIVFIIATLALTIFFGVWSWMNYFGPESTTAHLVYGILTVPMLGLIVWYARFFMRKLRTLSYL